jgi:hypothetical protein
MQRFSLLPFLVLHFLQRSVSEGSIEPPIANIPSYVLKDDLFICNACDTEGVPELMRCSGMHTEEHHLIRCLAPKKVDDNNTPATEERLTSIESRLDGMQTRFDDLNDRIGDITSRMGNIEQLLRTLARIGGGGSGGEGGAAQP